jgi:hypothetical protein
MDRLLRVRSARLAGSIRRRGDGPSLLAVQDPALVYRNVSINRIPRLCGVVTDRARRLMGTMIVGRGPGTPGVGLEGFGTALFMAIATRLLARRLGWGRRIARARARTGGLRMARIIDSARARIAVGGVCERGFALFGQARACRQDTENERS